MMFVLEQPTGAAVIAIPEVGGPDAVEVDLAQGPTVVITKIGEAALWAPDADDPELVASMQSTYAIGVVAVV